MLGCIMREAVDDQSAAKEAAEEMEALDIQLKKPRGAGCQ